MNRTRHKALRLASGALFVGGLLGMQAMPAFAQNGGTEVKGPEVEFAAAIVVQPNIKVDASMPGSGDNEQTGDSNAEFDQSVDAESGEPNATTIGGVAVSGPAIAGALGIAVQTNIQVIAGWTPEGGVDQEAGNDLVGDQTSSATSGDPSADGIGSAVTGSAVAWDTVVAQQTNVQTFVGPPSDD